VVDEEISQHRAAQGPADERCSHRVSQGRVPLSQTESAKDSGHYLPVPHPVPTGGCGLADYKDNFGLERRSDM
jgi:hypothetical protein